MRKEKVTQREYVADKLVFKCRQNFLNVKDLPIGLCPVYITVLFCANHIVTSLILFAFFSHHAGAHKCYPMWLKFSEYVQTVKKIQNFDFFVPAHCQVLADYSKIFCKNRKWAMFKKSLYCSCSFVRSHEFKNPMNFFICLWKRATHDFLKKEKF